MLCLCMKPIKIIHSRTNKTNNYDIINKYFPWLNESIMTPDKYMTGIDRSPVRTFALDRNFK